MEITFNHYFFLSALLFSIGLYGALSRRNAVAILMSIEIMFNGVNVALVAISRYIATPVQMTGQVLAIFVITVAAAEAAIALALLIALYRSRNTVDAEDMSLLRW